MTTFSENIQRYWVRLSFEPRDRKCDGHILRIKPVDGRTVAECKYCRCQWMKPYKEKTNDETRPNTTAHAIDDKDR